LGAESSEEGADCCSRDGWGVLDYITWEGEYGGAVVRKYLAERRRNKNMLICEKGRRKENEQYVAKCD
jgi:hypothetical protein